MTVGVAIMLNNLLHDFSVALLAASLVTLWAASSKRVAMPRASLVALHRILSRFMAGCWVVIIAGGAVRTWAYREYEWAPYAGRGQVTALVIKHVILVGLVIAGLVAQRRISRRIGA